VFAMGVKTSLLGVGVELAARATHRTNVRAGFNILGYSRNFNKMESTTTPISASGPSKPTTTYFLEPEVSISALAYSHTSVIRSRQMLW